MKENEAKMKEKRKKDREVKVNEWKLKKVNEKKEKR